MMEQLSSGSSPRRSTSHGDRFRSSSGNPSPGRSRVVSQDRLRSMAGVYLLGVFWAFGLLNGLWTKHWDAWTVVYFIKTVIEVAVAAFLAFYVLVAWRYRAPRQRRQGFCAGSVDSPIRDDASEPSTAAATGELRCCGALSQASRTAVVYLCCDDLDVLALESIVTMVGGTGIDVIVHDDSREPAARREVDAVVADLRGRSGLPIEVIRRANRVGGKPGAVNGLIERLDPNIEYIVLCDSDSFFYDSSWPELILPLFSDPQLAIVQCRNVGHVVPEDAEGYEVLSSAVGFYDVFVSFVDQFGWSPFLGHNAILRVSAIRQVGGLTPGALADDIDLSVKLRLQGYGIRYARNVVCGERHPVSYEALRRRAQKWAYGCTQVLLDWSWPLLKSRDLSFAEKTTFALTVGFYQLQTMLLLYLGICYIVLPFRESPAMTLLHVAVSAGLVLLLTFLPSLAYFARTGRLRAWAKAALWWGLTYGSLDFVTSTAIVRRLLRRRLPWVPTNASHAGLALWRVCPELCFGLAIVIVAAVQHPVALLVPSTGLFAAKFLVPPLLNRMVFRSKRDRSLRRLVLSR